MSPKTPENTASLRTPVNKNPALQPNTEGLYPYCSILYSICQEENINFQLLSLNWVKRLEKAGRIHYIVGYKFDLNSYGAGSVADDKYATYCALNYANIPAAEHQILYDFTNQDDYARGHNSFAVLEQYFNHHQQHIVIKPCCGTGGRQVYQLTDLEQALPILAEIFYNQPAACLCPFYHIQHEYRVILLDDEVRLAYMKTLQNPQADWKFNLQQGSIAEEIPLAIYDQVVALAKQAARQIGLRFCSVDIVQLDDDQLLVLELNSGVMTKTYLAQHPDQYELIKNLYRDAIRKMFTD